MLSHCTMEAVVLREGIEVAPQAPECGIDGIRTRTRSHVDTLATCLTTTVTNSRSLAERLLSGYRPRLPLVQHGARAHGALRGQRGRSERHARLVGMQAGSQGGTTGLWHKEP